MLARVPLEQPSPPAAMPSPSWGDDKRMEAVEKVVLHRAHVSRITRLLKNRLALASYKTKRGWENLGLDSIEPKVRAEQQLLQNEPEPFAGASPVRAEYFPPPLPTLPAAARVPGQQENARRPVSRRRSPTKLGAAALNGPLLPATGAVMKTPRKRSRTLSTNPHGADPLAGYTLMQDPDGLRLLDTHDRPVRLNQSSPVYPGVVDSYPLAPPDSVSPRKRRGRRKKVLDASLLPDAPPVPTRASAPPAGASTSPPRTPPPKYTTLTSSLSSRTPTTTGTFATPPPQFSLPKTGEEGADLLLFLATSPSPAQRSSFHTPGRAGLLGATTGVAGTPPVAAAPFGSARTLGPATGVLGPAGTPQTPSQAFNFAEYVNIFTPSPAQGQWRPEHMRSEREGAAAIGARRHLNFDGLDPAPTPPAAGAKLEVGGQLGV
ncbi:uncharacterized protein V1510DRAFT_414479 [Dipodascopsis tothii]|uniref:uncharacterized protein n=1 Tax=Dipodascopsis tothii TaxID=44089 RepID=UPI0034CD9D02